MFSKLAAALAAVSASVLGAAKAPEEVAAFQKEPFGTHFIVLIDDSKDMNRYRRQWILDYLPGWLEGQRVASQGEAGTESLPRYEPGRDLISVAFFNIQRDGTGPNCKSHPGLSARPESIFQWQEINGAAISDFENQLSEWMNFPCRKKRDSLYYSPIATAPTLSLSAIRGRIPDSKKFSRTLVAVVTNGLYNHGVAPAAELSFLGSRPENRVNHTDVAIDLARGISRFFYLDASQDWRDSFNQDLWYFLYQVRPLLPPPESALSYRRGIAIDRQAVEGGRIGLFARERESDRLVIRPPEHVVPLFLEWRAEDEQGGAWRFGEASLPETWQRHEWDGCGNPHCEFSWLDSLTAPQKVHADQMPPSGWLRFRVHFRVDPPNGIYNHLVVSTPEQKIRLEAVQPRTVVRGFPLPDLTLDNEQLAALWEGSDRVQGGLTHSQAVARVQAQGRVSQIKLAVLALLFMSSCILTFLFYQYRTAYHRPFVPLLGWEAVEDVVIDFNRQPSSPLLVGTLQVQNPGKVPWFGRLVGNREQPTREATAEVEFDPLEEIGFKVRSGASSQLGFLVGSRESLKEGPRRNQLSKAAIESISQGKRIYLFLDSSLLRDFTSGGGEEAISEKVADLCPTIWLRWKAERHESKGAATDSEGLECPFRLRIRPEAACKPEVEFVPSAEDKLYFSRGSKVRCGAFRFRSRARHRFATPFRGEFSLRSYKENLPLAGEPIQLERDEIHLAAKSDLEIPVLIHCDGKAIVNPEPRRQRYRFLLAGEMAAQSNPGPYEALLYRDPTRAKAELQVTYMGVSRDIYWDEKGELGESVVQSAVPEDDKARLEGGSKVVFGRPFSLRFREGSSMLDVMSLQVGNSARSGWGVVTARVRPRLVLGADQKRCLQLRRSYSPDRLLRLFQGQEAISLRSKKPHFRIREGEAAQVLKLRLDPSLISRIDGARIPADQCQAEVSISLTVKEDDGATSRRQVTLAVPLELEQLPGPNWLCIDFGTSAIAAALGREGSRTISVVDLQAASVTQSGHSFDDVDPENSEDGTPFLPSWVICDADLRQDASQDPSAKGRLSKVKGLSEGFPGYRPASQRPGDPSFLGLPALQFQLASQAGRVIFSLKSWLGRSAEVVRLGEAIRLEQNGEVVQDDLIPLEETVESAFAGLIEAYLKPPGIFSADQVVLSCPNTFTVRHKDRLKRVAQKALMKRLNIASAEHIRLISESDAIAYHYCQEELASDSMVPRERILVYDFGAGTLDISIVLVHWNRSPRYPKSWLVESRIGVPVAGNSIDEILARLIDRLLKDPSIVSGEHFEYQFPVVAWEIPAQQRKVYRSAIVSLWREIRAAKHSWDGKASYQVKVGEQLSGQGVVRKNKDADQPSKRIDGQACVFAQGDDIFLSIPAQAIHQDIRAKAFLDFVTQSVLDEALFTAGVRDEDIDTLLVSGRGALWHGIRENLKSRFPKAKRPDFFQQGVGLKDAVVRGAIARQSLLNSFEDKRRDESRLRLAILASGSVQLILEDQWGPKHPISLVNSPEFRIVQVASRRPDPIRDMKTLRRHFYIDLTEHPISRDILWKDDPYLIVEADDSEGELEIRLRNRQGQHITAYGGAEASAAITRPPWPVGSVLLDPEEEE